MSMRSLIRLTSITFVLLALSMSASAAQSAKHSSPRPKRHTSHPSHPMRNTRPKRHAMDATESSLLAARYLQPQQKSAAIAKTSSAASSSHSSARANSSPASSKKKKASKKSRRRREPTQKAPTPDRISEIQSSLARGGFYESEPNGKWDANTIAAMQKFQSANGLEASGKLDAPSLQKLGLGSGIAGVSAPRPACCSTTPGQGGSRTAPSNPVSAPAAPAPAPSALPSTARAQSSSAAP